MAISFCLTWRNSKQELHENLCHHLFLPQKTGYFWGSLRRLRKVKRFEWRIRCWFFFFNFLPTYRWEFDFLCWAIYEDSALDDLGLLEWFLTKIFCLPLPVISRVVTLFIYTGWNPRLPIYFRPFIDVNNHTLIAGCLGRHPRWFPSPLGKPPGRPGILKIGRIGRMGGDPEIPGWLVFCDLPNWGILCWVTNCLNHLQLFVVFLLKWFLGKLFTDSDPMGCKSPCFHHHLGEYVLLFSNHLKQI